MKRLLTALALSTATAAIAIGTQVPVVRAAGGCDNSGAYTDTLCAGGHLNVNQYLISPNGRYRFFYQDDGHTLIYDTIDWTNWVPSSSILPPHADASYLMYGVDGSGTAANEVTLWSFNGWNSSALPYYLFWGDAQGSGHYLRLEDDGCLRAYEADGRYITTIWC